MDQSVGLKYTETKYFKGKMLNPVYSARVLSFFEIDQNCGLSGSFNDQLIGVSPSVKCVCKTCVSFCSFLPSLWAPVLSVHSKMTKETRHNWTKESKFKGIS